MVNSSQATHQTTRASIVYTSNGLQIFGVLHRPQGPASAPRPGVVLYHGFMASKCQPPHRIFVQLAETLAQLGVVSLRIDLPGRGDSEGESIDITVDGDLDAARSAIDVLCAQPDVDAAILAWSGLAGVVRLLNIIGEQVALGRLHRKRFLALDL